LVRARAWSGIPLTLAILIGAGWLTGLIVHDPVAATILPLFGVGALIETRRHLPQWSFLAAQLLSALLVASVVYLIYAGAQPFVDRLGLLGIAGSFLLLLLEASALALSVYYLFEILDVFSRRTRTAHHAQPAYQPPVAIQLPCYNGSLDAVPRSLAVPSRVHHAAAVVQVPVDNPKDPQ